LLDHGDEARIPAIESRYSPPKLSTKIVAYLTMLDQYLLFDNTGSLAPKNDSIVFQEEIRNLLSDRKKPSTSRLTTCA